MSATLASQPALPAPAAAPAPPLRLADPIAPAAEAEAAELHRWLVWLGTPFLLGALFFALSVGVTAWLIAPALVFGPVWFMLSTIYLCLTSDTNAVLPPPA